MGLGKGFGSLWTEKLTLRGGTEWQYRLKRIHLQSVGKSFSVLFRRKSRGADLSEQNIFRAAGEGTSHGNPQLRVWFKTTPNKKVVSERGLAVRRTIPDLFTNHETAAVKVPSRSQI